MTSYITPAGSADNSRLWRSKWILTPAADTYDLVKIPQFAFIKDVWFFVSTAGSSDTIQLGFVGNGAAADPDYFCDADELAATTAGMKRAYDRNLAGDIYNVTFPGLWCTSAAGMVYMTVGTTQSTGLFICFVDYVILH